MQGHARMKSHLYQIGVEPARTAQSRLFFTNHQKKWLFRAATGGKTKAPANGQGLLSR